MKIAPFIFALAAASLASSLPARAQQTPADQAPADQAQRADVVQRGADGHASAVRENGQDYPVCTQTRQDGCIQPRAAGLKWGNRPLNTWPGKPSNANDGDQGRTAQ